MFSWWKNYILCKKIEIIACQVSALNSMSHKIDVFEC